MIELIYEAVEEAVVEFAEEGLDLFHRN